MKLIFPSGEHEQVQLEGDRLIIGSGKDCQIRLVHDGVAPHHAVFIMRDGDWFIEVDDPNKMVMVNGTQLRDREQLKAGDALTIADVRIRLVASVNQVVQPATANKDVLHEDDGRTKIRQALPRFSLRGVSGEVFGKTIPLHGKTVIGRQEGCDIVLSDDAISRQHVRITVFPDGVKVEDLGSANGTFINGKRISEGWLEDGDELKLDSLRFLFQAPPGLKAAATRKTAQVKAPAEDETVKTAESGKGGGNGGLMFILAGVVVLAILGAMAWFYFNGGLK